MNPIPANRDPNAQPVRQLNHPAPANPPPPPWPSHPARRPYRLRRHLPSKPSTQLRLF